MATPVDVVVFVVVSNVVKFVRREIEEIVRYLPHKKISASSQTVATTLLHGSRPKFARASRKHLAHNLPNFIQIGSLSAEL